MVGKVVSLAETESPQRIAGPLPLDDWMGGVRNQFEAVANDPDRYPYSAPLAGAVLINFDTPRGDQLTRILHRANPERFPEEAYRLIRSSYVAQLLQREGFTYPDDYTTVESCLDGIRWAQQTFPDGNRLNEIYRGFDLSTTVWKRYATAKILGFFMLDRNGGEGRVRADLGCSDLTGMTAVLASDIDPEFSFAGIEVLEKKDKLWVPSKARQDALDHVVSQPDSAGLTVGADRVDPTLDIVRHFVEGSMTPEELHDGSLPSGHHKLLRMLHSGVFADRLKFVEADISHKAGVDKVRKAAGGKVDEAVMSLVWHQGRWRKRHDKFDRAHDLVGPDGVVEFIDFARRDMSGPEPYLAPVRWTDLNVIVSAPDDNGDRRLYIPIQWTDGRCHQARFTTDLIDLAHPDLKDLARELADPA